MIPYTSEDYELSYCREVAEELRRSGAYRRVEVRKKRPEGGQEYGRVYVEPRPLCPYCRCDLDEDDAGRTVPHDHVDDTPGLEDRPRADY